MAQPYVGEIRMFAGNFAPAGWAFCSGQQLPISEHETLFQLLGTSYGGDGASTFALPNMQGRLPLHQGNSFMLAETGGVEEVTLSVQQIPPHQHVPLAAAVSGTSASPQGNVLARWADTPYALAADSPAPVALAPAAVDPTGGSQPHTNMPPYLAVSFIISLFGIFPSQT